MTIFDKYKNIINYNKTMKYTKKLYTYIIRIIFFYSYLLYNFHLFYFLYYFNYPPNGFHLLT